MAPPRTPQQRLVISQSGIQSTTTQQPTTPNEDTIVPTVNTTTEQQSPETNQTTNTATNNSGDISSITTSDSNHVYKTKGTLFLVKLAVNTNLFPRIKFIRNKEELEFSNDENSICQIVLTNINIPRDQVTQIECWTQIKHHVPLYMNRKRTSVTLAIKNKFIGTSKKNNDKTKPTIHTNHRCQTQDGLINTVTST